MSFTAAEYSHLWYTPKPWLDWARATLGPYYDPCPQGWQGQDGSDQNTWGRQPVYLNHPGGRGNFERWHSAFCSHVQIFSGIWCGFNLSQLRLAARGGRSFLNMPGYLIIPHDRIKYIWGGPDLYRINKKLVTILNPGLASYSVPERRHGQEMSSPSCDSFFWSSVRPAETPVPCDTVSI